MTNKILGAVKNWNPERGYGFLRTEGYDKDIFFPRRELPPDFQNEPNINGFSFAFEMTSAPDGRPQAKGLQCMGGLAQPTPPPSAGMERIGERVQGQVKSFSSKGGYGFMSMPGSGDIFFAKRDIPMAMQETNLIGTRFEFEIGRSNDGRTQAKNLVCLDPSGYAPGVAPPTPRLPGESFPDGSRMAGQIKMIGQEGGIITCPTASEELPFTPNDLPAVLQRKVMAGDFMQIQSASVLFSMVNAQGRSFAKEVVVLPPPEEILIGEVVQFNAGAGYGFIKPGPHGIFQQDVYFNTKDMVSLTEQQRLSLAGQSCRFHLRLTPDNRPQARKVELLSAVQPTSRFSYEPPPSALPQGAATGFSEKRPGGVLEEPASKRQA